MSRLYKYLQGEKIGPYGAIYIKDVPPKILKNGKEFRQAEMVCGFCGEHFVTNPNQVRRGIVKSCGCQKYIGSQQQHKRKISEILGKKFGRLTVLSDSEEHNPFGARQVVCRCDCGKEILATINNLESGNTKSCGCLANENRRNKHLPIINEKIGKLTVLEYLGKSTWRCKCECGNIVTRKTESLSRGNCSCGCESSKGEYKLAQLLKSNNIRYIQEYSFEDCINPKTNRKLRFDFYLPDYNCCIEYDGRQHNDCKGSYADLEGLENIEHRDWIKTTYCQDNNIGLVRINHSQYENINFEDLIFFIENHHSCSPLYNKLNMRILKAFDEYDKRR